MKMNLGRLDELDWKLILLVFKQDSSHVHIDLKDASAINEKNRRNNLKNLNRIADLPNTGSD